MNENNITRRKEVDLEIADFLWEIVRNWRIIGICLILGAVFLSGYQYMKDSRNVKAMPEEVVETYKKTIEEMESALGTQDLDQVYGAVAIRKQLDEKSAYAKNSPLMAINPYEENVISLQYYVRSETEDAAEIAAIYQEYLLKGELASELITCDGQTEQTYTKESYETGFTVLIRGENEAACSKLADTVKSGINTYVGEISGNLTAHEIKLVKESYYVTTDQELAQLQDDTALAIKNLSEHLDTIKSKLNGNQLELYVEYTENQPGDAAEVTDDENDKAQDTVEETQTAAASDKSVHISIYKLIIGGVLGAVLAILLVLLKYLLSGKLRQEGEIKTLYHNDVLGTVRCSVDRKRNKIDQWYVQSRYGKSGRMTLEQEIDLICANLKISCKDNQNVYLTGSDLQNVPSEVLDKIKSESEKREVSVIIGKEICYHADALEKLAEIGQVVFIETIRKSGYNDMYQEVIRCREHQIPILGTIVVGV